MFFSIKKTLKSYWLPILSGLLIGTSYIPFPPWALFFCLVPLWIYWQKENSLKKIFFAGWLTQFTLTLIGFHWIAHTTIEYGHMPWPIGIIVLILFSAHANLHIPLAGIIWFVLFKKDHKSSYSIFGLALTTAAMELIFPQIFPWNMGYPWFWFKLPGYHFADIIGIHGLSALTICSSAGVLIAWQSLNKKKHLTYIGIGLILFNVFGFLWGNRLNTPEANLKITLIQANIGNFEKFMAEKVTDFKTPIIQKYFELTRRALQKQGDTDLIIWPETAFPANMHESQRGEFYQSQLKTFVQSISKPLLTGSYTDIPNGPYFNSLYYLDTNGNVTGHYDKSILLAFGEYFPLSDYFPFLKDFIEEISDFGRGAGPSVMLHNEVKLAPQVCYEGLYPYFSRTQSNLGAEIFINVTNDSWFGHTFESYQHLYMTLSRAVEFRRPFVRVTNTGISAIVTAQGKVLTQSSQQSEWFDTIMVPFEKNPEETFYARYGFWLTQLLVFLALFMSYLLANVRKSRLG